METYAADPQRHDLRDLLHQGIAAAKSGQRERARDLLTAVVEEDERVALAWLWLSGVVDGLEEQEICLENALTLEPDNAAAHKGLAWVRQQREAQAQTAAEPVASPASPVPSTPRTGEDILSSATLDTTPPRPPATIPRDEFDDEYLCLYCAGQTEPDDRKCQTCGNQLWVGLRHRKSPSKLLWILVALQLFSTLQLSLFPMMVLMYASTRVGMVSPLALLNVYLGLPSDLPPLAASAALAIVPRAAFFISALPLVLSATVLIALYVRWKPVYYLLLLDAGWGLISAIGTVVLVRGITFGVTGVVLAVLRLLLVFQLEDDFRWDRRRLTLRLDPGLKTGADYAAQGNTYARHKMWAMSAIHYRQAAGLQPQRLDLRLALSVAYARIGRYDRATQSLEEARHIEANDPRIEEMLTLVQELQRGDQAGVP
jgi:hypothetical protein